MSYNPYEFNDGDLITEERINSLRAFGLTDANLSASANISWTKVDKTGSALTDFFTGPTIPLQFIPSGIVDPIVNADIASGANIDWSKINKTGSSLGDLGTRTISQITDFPSQSSQGGKVLSTDGSSLSWISQSTSIGLLAVNSTTSQIGPITSGPYVDTGLSVTFTSPSTSVFIFALGGGMYIGGANLSLYVGVQINGNDYNISHLKAPASSPNTSISTLAGGVLVTGLTAGNTYVAKLRAATNSASFGGYLNLDGSSRVTLGVLHLA